jgi:drug/metabolite transporter (DMT)-like permease
MSAAAESAAPAPSTSKLAIAAALAAVYVVWGSTYLGIRVGLEGYPPFLLGALRMFFPGLLMFLVLRARGVPGPTRRQWGTLAVLSIWMVLLSNGLVNYAEQDVSSGLAAIAVASMPLWAALFSVLRGQHPSRGEWLGLGIGFAGVLWLNAGGELSGTPRGMIALIVAPIAWAWGSIWSRGLSLPAPFMSAAGQMLCGSIWMLATGLLLGERIGEFPGWRPTLAVAYLGVFGSVIAFTAYVWLLQHVRPALATSYAYVNPPIAVMFGVLLLGERFTAHDLGAMAVILVGVVIITLSKAKKR